MKNQQIFPPLTGWEATRDTLHLYSQAVGVIPRALAEFHPYWWHISLKVVTDGLITDEMPMPGGGSFRIKMNLVQHTVDIITDRDQFKQFSMAEGLSSSEFGDQILEAVADLGISREFDRSKFEDAEPRKYKKDDAERYFSALTMVEEIFQEHRANIHGYTGPVQFWPHNFDLAFEWFGTRMIKTGEGDEKKESPAQLNLGFAPGDSSHAEPYFYSNPYPFEKNVLLDKRLPKGARWFTESWQGTLMPYSELAGDKNSRKRLLDYARAVYEICSPALLERAVLMS